jgi:N-methylhydantoinase B
VSEAGSGAQPSEPFVLGPSVGDPSMLERPLAVDPVTFEVLRHKLDAINEEQAITLKAVSASPIVTDASDFNTGIYLPAGEIVSMGPQVVYHSGAMPIVIDHVIQDCSENPGIGADDMFVVNDPYKGPVHHPDVALVAPIHHRGQLIGWAGAAAHEVDVGGMSVGSISVGAREKQQEGLMLPPVKLVQAGRLRSDIWRLILNMTRQPEMVGLDLKGFIASNVVAKRRVLELIDEYGLETVRTVMREAIRYSERRFRERLLELPDAEVRSRGFVDHDGHENRIYRVDVRVQKQGDVLRFDLSDSSPQAPGFINCTASTLVGAVFGGMAPILGREIPWNQGLLNAVEVIAPAGLVCNALPPAPTGSATIATGWVVVSTIVHALSKLVSLSEKHARYAQAVTNGSFDALVIGDRNQYGERYGTQVMDAQLGGGGAGATADGIDQSGGFVTPRPDIPNVESSEMHGPMLYLYRSYFRDSGGDGAWRGGRAAGLAFTPHGVERLHCTLTTQGLEVPVSPGLFGGWPGRCNRHHVIRGTKLPELIAQGALGLELSPDSGVASLVSLGGQLEALPAKVELELRPGDVLAYSWAGGGGFGDPLERPVALVGADVEAGVLSPRRAAETYGVVPESRAGVAPREELRKARLRRAVGNGKASGVSDPGEVALPFGPAMRIARTPHGLRVDCRCGAPLGAADGTWKLGAARAALTPSELPDGLRLHPDLELVELTCPGCGTLLSVEVCERGAETVPDLVLHLSGRMVGSAGDQQDA